MFLLVGYIIRCDQFFCIGGVCLLKWLHRPKSALTFSYTKFEISKFSFFKCVLLFYQKTKKNCNFFTKKYSFF